MERGLAVTVYKATSKDPGGQLLKCGEGIASFPGLPTIQFLNACSIQNGGGRPGIFNHVNDISVY